MANSITEVRLLNVPLENDYLHTLYFETKEAQATYFENKKSVSKIAYNLSYQRKDNIIRYPAQYDSLLGYNYVMYKNAAYSDRWFYAFITDMQYIDDGRTDIYIETDVMQTWLFNFTVRPSFVEREHVDSDIIGEHTVPEQLETGEYICNKHTKADYSKSTEMMIVVGATKTPDGNNARGTLYNNIYSGVNYYTFPNTIAGATALQSWLNQYSGDGAKDAITCMYLAPVKLAGNREDHTIAGTNFIDTEYINNSDGGTINTTIGMTDNTLNGYTPRNKKLMSYPYRCLLASNNSGGAAKYKYEQFYEISGNTKTFIPPQFKIEGCLTPGCSVRMIPTNYNGVARNDEEAINLGKFPSLNWTSDVYTNWLTQNGVNIAVSLGASALQVVGGLAASSTGAGAIIGAGSVAMGISGIASSVGEVYSHSLQPPQAEGNLNSGDVVTASGNNDFHFYDITIKKEYAAILDEYFDMFGYKVNRVKTPNSNHRENYWFIKTINVNIDGAIPTKDLQKIKDCYNNGVTFWKNPFNIGNYNVSNSITV